MADPYPKERQLARGERRYRRKIASPKQWAAIRAEKIGPCRLCGRRPVSLHHLLSRARGGPDAAWNIVPLCHKHHQLVGYETPHVLTQLAAALTDDEYAGLVQHGGENVMQRLFGVYERKP